MKTSSPTNFLSRSWWYPVFFFFEKNVQASIPCSFSWPISWPPSCFKSSCKTYARVQKTGEDNEKCTWIIKEINSDSSKETFCPTKGILFLWKKMHLYIKKRTKFSDVDYNSCYKPDMSVSMHIVLTTYSFFMEVFVKSQFEWQKDVPSGTCVLYLRWGSLCNLLLSSLTHLNRIPVIFHKCPLLGLFAFGSGTNVDNNINNS